MQNVSYANEQFICREHQIRLRGPIMYLQINKTF